MNQGFATTAPADFGPATATAPVDLEGRPACVVHHLGTVPYQAAWDRQRELAASRANGEISDTLLLLEHPHTYTLGRTGNRSNILAGERELAAIGARVFEIDRGGDVTYHGPGQLVGYPIMLVENRADLLRYIRNLEEVLIRAVGDFGIRGGRVDGLSGVWVGDAKIAAIGVKMGRVTSHGFALNVTTDLSYFGHIIPCGIRGKDVTSMERCAADDTPLALADVSARVVAHFGQVFGREMLSA